METSAPAAFLRTRLCGSIAFIESYTLDRTIASIALSPAGEGRDQ
jgi:hypothetical protein